MSMRDSLDWVHWGGISSLSYYACCFHVGAGNGAQALMVNTFLNFFLVHISCKLVACFVAGSFYTKLWSIKQTLSSKNRCKTSEFPVRFTAFPYPFQLQVHPERLGPLREPRWASLCIKGLPLSSSLFSVLLAPPASWPGPCGSVAGDCFLGPVFLWTPSWSRSHSWIWVIQFLFYITALVFLWLFLRGEPLAFPVLQFGLCLPYKSCRGFILHCYRLTWNTVSI